jgi:hypothetical protein
MRIPNGDPWTTCFVDYAEDALLSSGVKKNAGYNACWKSDETGWFEGSKGYDTVDS